MQIDSLFDMSESFSFVNALNSVAFPQGPTDSRKRKAANAGSTSHHKSTEQKGRQKINDQINELKSLLPECKFVTTTKASVLECAVNSLKKLQVVSTQLSATNKKLRMENRLLLQELERYVPQSEILGLIDKDVLNTNDEASGDANANPIAPSAYPGLVNELLQAETFASNIQMMNGFGLAPSYPYPVPSSDFSASLQDPILHNIDSSSSSPSQSSGSSPNSSPVFNLLPPTQYQTNIPAKVAANAMFQHQQAHYAMHPMYPMSGTAEEDGYYKVTKRKLFVLFLLMVPLFLSFDSFSNTGASSNRYNSFNGRNRVLMGYSANSSVSGDILTAIYYFDVVRFLLYFVMGILGIKWTTNSLLWLAKLQSNNPFGIKV